MQPVLLCLTPRLVMLSKKMLQTSFLPLRASSTLPSVRVTFAGSRCDDVRVVFRDLTDFCFNFKWKLLPAKPCHSIQPTRLNRSHPLHGQIPHPFLPSLCTPLLISSKRIKERWIMQAAACLPATPCSMSSGKTWMKTRIKLWVRF